MTATPYFIPPYRKFSLRYADEPQVCDEDEHAGDSYEQPTINGDHIEERWTCCDEATVIGEVFDCDTYLEPGITPTGAKLPAGWIEDTNGHHCPRCQP